LRASSALIGFDTASWLLAERAAKLNKPFFLDQSISHPLANQEIMQAVARSFPEWGETIEARLPQVLACERQEYQLANKIVAASSFTKQTLVAHGIPADKIVINPYGVDLQTFHPPESSSTPERPLRFLFLGLISARKGVPLILEAWRKLALKQTELWLVGPLTESVRALIPPLPGLKVIGKIHRQDLPDLLRQCDVLVFPSYCEGFGLVLLEALASGLPVITTDATAGPDLIRDGVEGRLIPTGDLDALCEAMQTLAREPDKLERMKAAARRCAERFSWEAYGDRWQQILRENV
jgi:glycosyltransferase involved in cell wall biosynthesis